MPYVKCKICESEFYVKPSHVKLGYGVYCSLKCRGEGQRKGRFVECNVCGKRCWKTPKDFKNSKSGKFFCSKSCQTKWRNEHYSGEKHWFWKGGECVYREKLLKSQTKKECKICGQKDLRVLEVHHLDRDRKNSDLKNLVWLCRNCHYLVHNFNEKIW